MPQEIEEAEGLDTKDLLSYSFRAVQESRFVFSLLGSSISTNTQASNLLQTIVSTLKFSRCTGALKPSSQTVRHIGNLSFLQLSELRHRGAFTTVSQTFATCCQSVKYLIDADVWGHALLEWWYRVCSSRSSLQRPVLITW